jgi:hypothetical protein
VIIELEDYKGPNIELLKYPPLSDLTNSYLISLNQIRKCYPNSIKYNSRQTFIKYLNVVINSINNVSIQENDKMVFKNFVQCFLENFLKYILNCFNIIFKDHIIKLNNLNELKY